MPSQPSSPRRLAANRAEVNRKNAALSTGPLTPEGKSRSSQNALRHGFTASTFTIARVEDPAEVARLKADLVHVYQPVNAQELFALERAALAQQSILRAARLEAGLFTSFANHVVDDGGHGIHPLSKALDGLLPQNTNYALADGYHRATHGPGALSWSLLLRYQAQAERLYRRAIEEFERLKKLRPELPNEDLPNEPIPEPPPDPQPLPAEPLPDAPPPPQTNPILPAAPPSGTPPPADSACAPIPSPTGHSGAASPRIPPRSGR